MKWTLSTRIGFFFIILPFVLFLFALLPWMVIRASLASFDKYAVIFAVAYEARHTFFK